MEKICDLHIHSRYSGGTSNQINIRKIAQNCRLKGIDIVGTGDCFHPLWLKEINLNLEEDSVSLLTFPRIPQVKFVLQSEVELLWKHNSNIKKAHFIILLPNFDKLKDVSEFLASFGNLNIDGRPVLKISPEKFIVNLESFDKMIEVIRKKFLITFQREIKIYKCNCIQYWGLIFFYDDITMLFNAFKHLISLYFPPFHMQINFNNVYSIIFTF